MLYAQSLIAETGGGGGGGGGSPKIQMIGLIVIFFRGCNSCNGRFSTF